jgi:hypothetical protein
MLQSKLVTQFHSYSAYVPRLASSWHSHAHHLLRTQVIKHVLVSWYMLVPTFGV